MNNKRFYVPHRLGGITPEDIQGVSTLSSAELVNQLKNVFRLRSGDQVIFFDNSGYDFLVNIDSFEKDNINFKILETYENTVRPIRDVFLFSSIIKKDNFEWVTQKATELGVTYIVPILSERSEKKNLNMERLGKILIEASEQSGRGMLPELHEIVSLEECVEKFSKIKSIAWHTEAPKFVSQNLDGVQGLYIGPEGGWSEKEIDFFHSKEIPVYSLGPQVLRAETAVVATLAQFVF